MPMRTNTGSSSSTLVLVTGSRSKLKAFAESLFPRISRHALTNIVVDGYFMVQARTPAATRLESLAMEKHLLPTTAPFPAEPAYSPELLHLMLPTLGFVDCVKAIGRLYKALANLQKDFGQAVERLSKNQPVDEGHIKEMRQRVQALKDELAKVILHCLDDVGDEVIDGINNLIDQVEDYLDDFLEAMASNPPDLKSAAAAALALIAVAVLLVATAVPIVPPPP